MWSAKSSYADSEAAHFATFHVPHDHKESFFATNKVVAAASGCKISYVDKGGDLKLKLVGRSPPTRPQRPHRRPRPRRAAAAHAAPTVATALPTPSHLVLGNLSSKIALSPSYPRSHRERRIAAVYLFFRLCYDKPRRSFVGFDASLLRNISPPIAHVVRVPDQYNHAVVKESLHARNNGRIAVTF